MTFDALTLSRIQFGLTVTFHIIFPSLSIGLSLFLVTLEGLWLKTGRVVYLELYQFWVRIFAMSFGVGVATGIVLSFEFGLNFSRFAQMAGPVIGPMISLEVLTAFFLEAGFLGIMLFGMDRVGRRLHFAATCLVALGTHISASWILSANSWMQTPSGVAMTAGKWVVVDWWSVVFNPSFLNRFVHMLLAAHLAAAFFAAGVAAWYLIKGQHVAFARRSLELSTTFAAVLVACQVIAGVLLADVMAQHQPGKFTAIEGRWETQGSAPYLLAIWPDSVHEVNRFEIGIPLLGSQLIAHTPQAVIPGIKAVPKDARPSVGTVFWSFRVMFYLSIAMFAACVAGLWLRYTERLSTARWYHRVLVGMTPAGIIATIAGWYVAEIGRQPWVVNGLLRTADAVSPVATSSVAGSLTAFALVDLLFLSGFIALTLRIIARGPQAREPAAAGPLKRILQDTGEGLPRSRAGSVSIVTRAGTS